MQLRTEEVGGQAFDRGDTSWELVHNPSRRLIAHYWVCQCWRWSDFFFLLQAISSEAWQNWPLIVGLRWKLNDQRLFSGQKKASCSDI